MMKDGFTKVTKAFKKDLKRLLTKDRKNANTTVKTPKALEVLG